MGRLGNVMLVNGRTDHQMEVKKGSTVRFYLTNVANSRTFAAQFGDTRVKLVASDVGRYEREQWVGSLVIGPAERYVAEVRFDEPGTVTITNTIPAANHFRGEFYPDVDTVALVHVSEEPVEEDDEDRFRTLAESENVIAEIDRYRSEFDRPVDKDLVTGLRTGNLQSSIVRMMEVDTLHVWSGTTPCP